MLRALLPWRDFVIDTRLPREVVVAEIQKRLGRPQLFASRETTPFVGELNGNAFRFRHKRVRWAKGTGPALIHAVVEPSHHDGSRIRVKMRPNASSIVPLVGFAGLVAFTVLRASPDARWSLGGFVFCFLLVVAAVNAIMFAFQANKAERFLREIFASAPAFPAPVETGVAYR